MYLKPYEYEKLIKFRGNQAKKKKQELNESLILKKKERNKKSANKLSEAQKKADNPNERKFKYLLYDLRIQHEYQKPFSCHKRYVCVDFYLPQINTVIEIDGYSHTDTKYKDIERTIYLKKTHGIKQVVRITNYDIANNINKVKGILLYLFGNKSNQ